MTKPPLQRCKAPQQFLRLAFSVFTVSASAALTAGLLSGWAAPASAELFIRVQSNTYPSTGSVVNFPPVVPDSNSIYSPVQTIVQPGYGGVQSGYGGGLSVQIGTSGYYPSDNYPGAFGYGRQFRHGQYRGSVNNSVLINPTVINSPIRNSTLVNPTIVTTPYYPAPFFNIQTVTTTTRPEPEVYVDPQYGVRYRSPSVSPVQPIVIYPQIPSLQIPSPQITP